MDNGDKIFTPRLIVQLLLVVVAIPFLPLLITWRWSWWEAWAYALIYVVGFMLSRALAARRHPDLLAERARSFEKEDAKPWDRYLAPLVGLGGGFIPLIAGLDARCGWSAGFDLAWRLAALVLILAGISITTYALLENRYFSGVVRIQKERGHQVVSSGPYRWMRHPGYAGAIVIYLATPILLEARWAFVPAVLLAILLVLRTYLEDRTLHEELDGYEGYARQVRYRLLPGVW